MPRVCSLLCLLSSGAFSLISQDLLHPVTLASRNLATVLCLFLWHLMVGIQHQCVCAAGFKDGKISKTEFQQGVCGDLFTVTLWIVSPMASHLLWHMAGFEFTVQWGWLWTPEPQFSRLRHIPSFLALFPFSGIPYPDPRGPGCCSVPAPQKGKLKTNRTDRIFSVKVTFKKDVAFFKKKMCVCVCVFVWERKREWERQT